ncbi:MAG: hypothetical protein ACTSO9_14855 [Candidatus Helarchaeota archaeon]
MSEKLKARVIKVKDLLKKPTKNYMLYYNYDNEAFMNTGIQESGSTPPFASTTTGPGGKAVPGKIGIKQDIINGFAFLGVKSGFFATVNVAYPQDFIGKVVEALKTPGTAFIQALTSCDRGWRHALNVTHKVDKLAVDSGLWPLFSIKVRDGRPTYYISRKFKAEPDREKLVEYIKLLGKYRHLVRPSLNEDAIDQIWEAYRQRNENILNLHRTFRDPEADIETYTIKPQEIPAQELLAPGYGLCAGCGLAVSLNHLSLAVHMVAGKNVIITNNTSCSEVSLSKDDVPSWKVPWMHHLFETAATIGDAIATTQRILKTKGRFKGEPAVVIAIGGDGSTYDIGYQFLKAALVRTGTFGIMNPLLTPK